MSILRYEPLGLGSSWPAEVFRLFDSVAGPQHESSLAQWQPRVDIAEFEDRYQLLADLPGVKPEDVDITLDNNQLSISGKRETQLEQQDAKQHRFERQSGEFMRQFTLPESADAENITARSEHGVLHIVIPKRSQAQPMKISIQH